MTKHTFAQLPYSFPFGFFAMTHMVLAIFFVFGVPASLSLVSEQGLVALLPLMGCLYGLYYISQLSFLAPLIDQVVGEKHAQGVVKSKSLFQTQRWGILEQFVVRPLEKTMGQPTARYWFKLQPHSRPLRVSQEMYHALDQGQTISATYTGFSRIVTKLEITGKVPSQLQTYEEKEQLQSDVSFRTAYLKPLKALAIGWGVLMIFGFGIAVLAMLKFILSL